MNKAESAVQVLGQIEALIGATTGKSVVAKLKTRIKELEDNFNEDVDNGNYDELIDTCGLDREELYYGKRFDRYELFDEFRNNNDYLYLDEIETFIQNLDDYESDRNRTARRIRDLREILED